MKKFPFLKSLCAIVAFCVAVVVASPAQTFTLLTKFNGDNGAWPTFGSLIQGLDANFYGTTSLGGVNNTGSVFKITPSGKVTTIYSFCSQVGCADGQIPDDSLVQTLDGNFYGTTYEGGASNNGTVFELTPKGELTTLHTFCSESNCADGLFPYAGLSLATNGEFYGVTSRREGVTPVYGTVFEMSRLGQLTTLYTFCAQTNCTDGSSGARGLILGASGKFYGVTGDGGAHNAGTIFEITTDGEFRTLHSFNRSDGASPNTLIQATDGNLYGTTFGGGSTNSGVIYELTPAGDFRVLYNFCSQVNCADGANPYAPLMEGSDGNFYGTTTFGGASQINQLLLGYGIVFQITPAGQFTILHTFCTGGGDCADGAYPQAGLTQGTDGNFYGTTYGRPQCPGNCGTVFRVSMGLAPFVEASQNFGRIGHSVNILGNKLTGTTSVSFNGVPATFKVLSNTFIMATLPNCATSGRIAVTTPTGTLSSNTTFEVIP
jgi:uncharacterized repeat protein (TIGR03803 family)